MPSAIQLNSLRGGGCGTSVHSQDESTIIQVQNQNAFDLFFKFSHYVQLIESKASSAANSQESQEIMIAIQWFVLKEENIYRLNKDGQSVKKSYDLILDGIIRLLKSCLIYIRTDLFKCFYILQITTSLSKVIFSFHLMNDKRYMKCDTQILILEICQEMKQQLEVEKNDMIQNQVQLYLQLTQMAFEIAPTNSTEKEEILKGCLKGLIISAISMNPDVDFFDNLFEGACLLLKKIDISNKKKQFELYYQIDMLQWEIINYFKDDKGKTLEEIILRIENMYETLVKSSQNWRDHYLWIQMIGKILIYNPLITKKCFGKLYFSTTQTEQRSLSQIWKDYKNKGLLIYTNHDNDQAVILLNQLQNSKTVLFDRLILQNFFEKWENLILLKEFLMNQQQENIPYTFGSYLKSRLKLESQVIDINILALKKINKFLGLIISNKLIKLIEQTYSNLGQIDKIVKSLISNKQINFRISQSTYVLQTKKIISNFKEYVQNFEDILKLFRLNQNENQSEIDIFQKNEFIQLSQFKWKLKLLVQFLQESIEESKEMKINKRNQMKHEGEIEKNENLQKQTILLQPILQALSQQKNNLSFVPYLQEMLDTLPSVKEKNFVQKSQKIITLIQDSQKQIKNYEIQLLQNGDLIKIFQELIQQLYLQYEQKNQELQKDQLHLILCMKEIMISQYEIDAALNSEDLEHIKNNFYTKHLIIQVQNASYNLLQLKFQVVSFKDSFQILLKSIQSEKFQKLEEAINFDKFLRSLIKNYPQRIISCHNSDKKQINFNDDQNFDEVTENELKNKLSKQKGIIQFLLFKQNLEQKEIDSEIKDLELIENKFGELFEEQFSSSQAMKKIQQLLTQIPIDKSIKNVSGEKFDESQLKFEKEIYENLLSQLKQINPSQKVEQITEIINSTEVLIETFKYSINKNVKIFVIPLCKRLKDLDSKIQKYQFSEKQINQQERKIEIKNSEAKIDQQEQQLVNVQVEMIEVNQADQQKVIEQHLENQVNLLNENNLNLNKTVDGHNQQNFDNQQIKNNKINNNEIQLSNLQFLIKIIKFKNTIISKQQQILENIFAEVEQFASTSDFILEQPSDIQQEMLEAFQSIIRNLRNQFESLLWIEVDQKYQDNANFQMHFEKVLDSFSKFSEVLDNKENKEIDQNIQESQAKIKLHDFLYMMKDRSQKKLVEAWHYSDYSLFEQEFIIQQLQKIYLEDKQELQLEEDLNQDLNLFDNFSQGWTDFKNNDEWKIKQGLVFTIIQISSNCFANSLIQFCQKTLIQLWVQEKDQRVRNILKNQGLISIQMQILQRDWKNQHDRIEAELQTMLIKIDDLQDQIAHEANLYKRDQQLKELDATTQQLEEYISNISEMGQQLKLITDFINYLRKGLKRVEVKINDMKVQLNSIGNDVKFLRGKSVEQLLEIRKWKVLKRAALYNVKSIYVPLKTIEIKNEKEEKAVSNLMNLQLFYDKEGEVNEFLLEGKTVLLIHGTAGSGKSTTALKIEEFIWKLQGKNQTNDILIPIYISLPSLKNPVYQAVEETLHQDEYGFDDLQLKECKEMLEQKKFRFLLVMDGYDEMKLENIQKNLYISNKLFYNWSNPLVIFTTRSEIFSSANYVEWFKPEDKKQLKEIKLLKFDESQKLEYLQKFTNWNIKMLIFETYEWQIQIQNTGGIDVTRFEMTWEQLENSLLKQLFLNTLKSEYLLNEKYIKSILEFLKNDDCIALKNVDAIRSLNTNLSQLWSVQKYQNIMKIVNLDKLIETPYMMQIVVQALPLILAKASDVDNLKYNFIKNFSKMMQDTLKSYYLIQMYEQQKKQLREQNNEIEQQVTLVDIHSLEEIDYPFASLEIWQILEQKQSLAKIQLNQEFYELKTQFLNLFNKINVSDLFLQGRGMRRLEIQNERTIDLVFDALKEKNLTSFDFYGEFIRQHHLKQIEKLRNLGKSINVDRFLHDLQQYSIKLAKEMSSKQLTQVQYKQQGLLFKDQNQEDEWLEQFFNDDGVDGTYKKDIRSCTLISQKGSNFQFVHKSIQEYLIAVDLFELLEWSESFDSLLFNITIEMLSKKEEKVNCLAFLSRETTLQDYDALMKRFENKPLFDEEKRSLENRIKQIINFIKNICNHDFNQFNYSTDIYAETRRFFINKVSKEKKIQLCLKFLVDLTAIDDSFGQCGSNALNLLVEMKVDLQKQSFQKIKIKNTSIAGANFSKCNFSGSYFENVNINGVNLNGALLINCKWINLRIDELHKFIGNTQTVKSVCFSPDGATLASGSHKTIRLWDVKTGAFKLKLDGHGGIVQIVCFSPDCETLASSSWDRTIRLWNVKTGTFKQKLIGHSYIVYSISFSADGAILASGSDDKTIRLWDVKTGAFKQQLDGHTGTIYSLCFSPDVTTLVSGSSDNTIRLWDMKTGALKQKLNKYFSYGESVCLSRDGATLAQGSSDKAIHLWDVKTGAFKQQLDGHTDYIQSLCFSPDCATLASGSKDKTIRLWDVKTGAFKQQLDGHTDSIESVCFSPDGATLASGSKDKTISLWDVKAEAFKQQLDGHTDSIQSVCFSPDGKTLVSGSRDKTIRLWDVKTGAFKQQLDGHTDIVYSVCISPDGTTLVSGGLDKTIRLWDTKTGAFKQQLYGNTDVIQSICFSSDGATLVSGNRNKTICLWDVKTGTFKQQLVGHTDIVYSVCISPDCATLASGSKDKTIRLWDVKTGAFKQQLDGNNNYVISVSFSPIGVTLASCAGENIRLWDVKTGVLKQQLDGHSDQVLSVCFSPDGATLASSSRDTTIRLWDAKTGAFKQQLDGHTGIVYSVCISPDGATLVSGGSDNTIRLWDVKTEAFKQELNRHTASVYSVCFSPDGSTLASCSGDKTIRLWDMKTGTFKQQFNQHTDSIYSVCFSPDGATLASGGLDKTIRLWDVKTEAFKLQLDGHTDKVKSVCFSPDGATLASSSWDKTIRLWDVKTGAVQQKFDGHTDSIESVCFSPDGATLASSSWDNTIRLWDVKTGVLKQKLHGHTDSVLSVCFSPDGSTIASSGWDKAILWDVKSGAVQKKLDGHSGAVYTICFSPDGTTLASGSTDQTICLWDGQTGIFKSQLDGHTGDVHSVCFSPDGTTLASGSGDKTIRLWDVKTGTFKQQLDGHTDAIQSLCFSPDCLTLANDPNSPPKFNPTINFQSSIFSQKLALPSLTIVLISPYFHFQITKALIIKGLFKNHLDMDLRLLFKQKGCILFQNDKD